MENERKVSSSFRKYLKSELSFWQNDDIVSQQQSDRIGQLYRLDQLGKESFSTLMWVIYLIAASLIGVGVISFVAAHWGLIPKAVKLTMIISLMLTAYISGFYLWQINGKFKKLGHSLIVLGTIIFGADIGLISQIFHIHSNPYNAFAAWAIGALVIAYALNSTPNMVIAIITSFIFFCGDLDRLFWMANYNPMLYYPFIAAAIFLPFAYRQRSALIFLLSMLAIAISTITVAASHGPDFLGFSIAMVAVSVLMLGWGLVSLLSERFRNFSMPAISAGTVFMLYIIFVLSFLEPARDLLKDRNWKDIEDWNWIVPVAACFVVGLPFLIAGMIKSKSRQLLGLFSTVQLLTALAVLAAILGGIIWQNKFIIAATCNIALVAIAIVFLYCSFKSGLRSLFWLGVFILSLMIISRSLEYDTNLLVKASAFVASGVGLLVGGIVFEKFLKKRRLTDA